MKQTIQFAVAIAVSAAAMFVYMYEPPPERVVQEVGQAAPSPTHQYAPSVGSHPSSNQPAEAPKRELTAAELADIDPASIDWEAVRERYKDITSGRDAMLSPGSILITDFAPEEIAAYNKLHVVPFNPAVRQECGPSRIELGDGVFEDSYGCVPVYERPEHPYESLSIEELRELVEFNADAEAAAIASRYAPTRQERLGFAIQASVLSGKSGPVLRHARRTTTLLVKNPSSEDIVAHVSRSLVLENVAKLLGDPRATPNYPGSISWLEEAGLNSAEVEDLQQAIKDSAFNLLKQMGEAQRDLTGATSILELTNA